jgi:hypothetical protein
MSAGYSPDLTTLISGPTPLILVDSGFPLALLTTMVIEGAIGVAYAAASGLRTYRWLTYAVLINLVTQPVLWYLMGLLPADTAYFRALTVGESLVWLAETVLLYLLAGGRLTLKRALVLSLVMNGVSLGVGLLLPV